MPKPIRHRFFLAAALVVGGVLLLNLYTWWVPNSALGWLRFQLLYNLVNRSAFLDRYRANIWEHGGGYIPEKTARFLNERLESSEDASEISAIVRFYSLQAGGRESPVWFELSDQARRRVASTVLREWKSYPPQSGMQQAFVLLEGLRQNTYVGKANVRLPCYVWPDSPQKLAPIAALFEKWNSEYKAVPFIKRPNPLAGSPYRIEAP